MVSWTCLLGDTEYQDIYKLLQVLKRMENLYSMYYAVHVNIAAQGLEWEFNLFMDKVTVYNSKVLLSLESMAERFKSNWVIYIPCDQ